MLMDGGRPLLQPPHPTPVCARVKEICELIDGLGFVVSGQTSRIFQNLNRDPFPGGVSSGYRCMMLCKIISIDGGRSLHQLDVSGRGRHSAVSSASSVEWTGPVEVFPVFFLVRKGQ